MLQLLRLSEYRALAAQRPPTQHLPFLGEVEKSPFVKGRSYLLSAFSKTGKTELMIQVVLGWADQEILWISEESQKIWEDRSVALQPVSAADNVRVCHGMGMSLHEIGLLVARETWDVLVIDTVKLLAIADENDSAEVMKKLRPILAKQQEDVDKMAILLHHTRKAGGTHGLGAAGSHAFTAAVDTVLEISRYKKPNQRRFHGEGRIEPVEDIIYTLEAGQLTVQREGDSVAERLMGVMTSEWQVTKALAEALDPAPADAGKALKILAKQGRIERDPPMSEGTKQGTTFSWRAAP